MPLQTLKPFLQVGAEDLLSVPKGPRTEACLRHNCVVGVQYLEAWLGGLGCVPLYNLMEDAATAEICRTQARPCGTRVQALCLSTSRHSVYHR